MQDESGLPECRAFCPIVALKFLKTPRSYLSRLKEPSMTQVQRSAMAALLRPCTGNMLQMLAARGKTSMPMFSYHRLLQVPAHSPRLRQVQIMFHEKTSLQFWVWSCVTFLRSGLLGQMCASNNRYAVIQLQPDLPACSLGFSPSL